MSEERTADERTRERVRNELESSVENLQRGRRVGIGGEGVPARPFAAIAVFVVVFAAVALLVWTLLGGGAGFAFGVIVGLLAAALAAKLYVDRGLGAA